MKFICSLIVVEDIERSRYLYESILGQSVKTDFGENVTFHGDFAIRQQLVETKVCAMKKTHEPPNNLTSYKEKTERPNVLFIMGRLKNYSSVSH